MAASDHNEKDKICVLADVSGSMGDIDGGTSEKKSRLDLLKQALEGLPKEIRILAFSDDVHEVTSVSELRLEGATNLAKAIRTAATFKPVRTVIISDGEPDSEVQAREEIEALTGVVDVIYCGSPKNSHARAFLESLAKEGMGGYYETGDKLDIAKQLPAVVKGLLGR
jgi:uncharacterized protein with von Willebrand factor type A (vWA) domain